MSHALTCLRSRLDNNQSETSTDNIEDDVTAGGEHDTNETVAIYWKQETELENLQCEDTENVYNSAKSKKRSLELIQKSGLMTALKKWF